MIRGLSGSVLSHEALEGAGLTTPDSGDAATVQRALIKWQLTLSRTAGPVWSARKVFDEIAAPLCSAFHFQAVPVRSDASSVHALLEFEGNVVAVLIACGWGLEFGVTWREAVRLGIAKGIRWCFCFNGPALRLYDATRTHSRRYLQLDIEQLVTEAPTFALAWRLLRGDTFAVRHPTPLDSAVLVSERHRASVRASLQAGVHDAITRLTNAFLTAAHKQSRPAPTLPSARTAYEESLVVIYRVLFLLFAEARALVPSWHPMFREGYSVESLQPMVEGRVSANGLWDALQAIARLAHRGCRAGTLRVPPFNGRLFSPHHAPLAESLPLDDTHVRDALLALTTTAGRDGRRRIAYADLGVEQLGGVYERVLDFDVSTRTSDGPVVLARGTRRKTTGSFYTPRSLTEHLVRRTLAPLVDSAEPDAILRLRVVDPAMGSGAFLVAACRYLAQSYETALVRCGVATPADLTDDERAGFRRIVAQKCLYGVDVNPMAVQLAQLSLWLATLCRDRPLTFFDRQLRSGNSLAGAALADVGRRRSGARLRRASLPLLDERDVDTAVGTAVRAHVELREGPEETLDHVQSKERLFENLNSPDGPLARWRRINDLWCAAWFADDIRGSSRGFFQSLLDGRTLPAHVAGPLLEAAQATARRERFFHWTLEFPEVFFDASGAPRRNGGFDAVVGNPPWEMLRGDSGPDAIRSASARSARQLTQFTRGSGVYRLHGSGHANLYQLFAERAISLTRPGGRVGLVLPSGFATDHGCADLRRHLLDATTVDSLVSVDNREAIFPVHRGLRFLLMTTTVGGRTPAMPLRAGLRNTADFDRLPETGLDPDAVLLSRELLERLSGNQLAIPDVRTAADAAVAARLVFAHARAGAEEGWALRFGRELNATDDKAHFVSMTRGALPVVEGKQLQPFQCDLTRSCNFIRRKSAAELIAEAAFSRPRVAYRDVAASSNRLTLIAAVLPPEVVTTHTVFCLKTPLDDDTQHFLCGMFNSFVANFLVRLRVTTHVTVTVMEHLPLPLVGRSSPAFGEMVALARTLAQAPSDTSAAAAHQALAAAIYGITAAEFEHILTTFPLVDSEHRRRALAAFRSKVAG